jgi:LPXTG-motif cell wall-anchored protein
LPEIKDNDKSVTLHKLKADELVRIYNTQATQVITGYTLPETGGGGNLPYTTGGLIMILASAGTILYGKHRRKEDESSF